MEENAPVPDSVSSPAASAGTASILQTKAHHIVVHMHPIDKAHVLRIHSVHHTEDYLKEYQQVYGEQRGDTYACFYNLAKWWDRLLDDFKYKTFKGITLSNVGKGVWTVECNDSTKVPQWFTQMLLPYLGMRLKGYNEEDAHESTNVLASLQELCDYRSIPIQSILKEVSNGSGGKGITFQLRHPEKHFANSKQYVLTAEDVFAILLCYEGFNMDQYAKLKNQEDVEKEENEKKEKEEREKAQSDPDVYGIRKSEPKKSPLNTLLKTTGFRILKGDDHQGFVVNQKTFHEDDILNNLDILGIDYKKYFSMRLEDHKYRDLKFNDLYPVCAYEKLAMGCRLEEFSVSSIGPEKEGEGDGKKADPPTGFRTRKLSDAEIETRFSLLQSLPRGPSTLAVDHVLEEKIKRNYYYVYMNILSKKKHLFDFEVNHLNELSRMCTLVLNTKVGQELLKQMMDMMNLSDPDAMDDFNAISSMIGFISNTEDSKEAILNRNSGNRNGNSNEIDALCNKKKTAIHLKTDKETQRFYTHRYVEKYRDDNAEMLAHLAIDCIYHYLCKHILPDKVNLNQIGHDLVDLGVKKTRKSRGHVYGLATPSQESSVRHHLAEIIHPWEITT